MRKLRNAAWMAAAAGLVVVLTTAGLAQRRGTPGGEDPMSKIAHDYVYLVLALGQHDTDYVDAYYGPAEIKREAEKASLTLDAIGKAAAGLTASLKAAPAGSDELSQLRHQYLEKQLSAMIARVRMLKGERLSFDEESKALYDAVAPTYPDSHFQEVLDRLEKRFPGGGSLVERYDAWKRAFVIPRE